jgi:hypothetical protein
MNIASVPTSQGDKVLNEAMHMQPSTWQLYCYGGQASLATLKFLIEHFLLCLSLLGTQQ